MRRAQATAALTAATLLAGCATFSPDGGFDAVQSTVKARTGMATHWLKSPEDVERTRDSVRTLLARELTADDAVQVALFHNRGLQATYADLGIAEADLVQAGRLANPHFAYLRTRHGGERKLEWALTFPIIDLLTMPLRTRLEGRRFEETKLAVAGRAVDVALETRRAWYHAVAAAQMAQYLAQVNETAQTSAELARRMTQAGNFSKLAHMREQAYYAESAAQLARARQASVSARERLTRLMGLYGDDLGFKLPDRLPDLPADLPAPGDVEATAIAQRYDVQSAKKVTESLADSLGLTKATRFINALELGPASTKEDPEPWKRGFEISLQIPLFDWGDARVAKAEAIYMQAVHRVAETAINARSEAREAYAAYRTAHDTARHYRDEIVPLRKKISEEVLLRYNGMLVGVFELLADAREQVLSVSAAIEAQRDFWLAENALHGALNGTPRAGGADGMAGASRLIARDPALAGH